MLPFLPAQRKVPKLRKLVGIKKYGFDEDQELQDFIASEMMEGLMNGDFDLFLNALRALIEFIRNEDETDSQEKA